MLLVYSVFCFFLFFRPLCWLPIIISETVPRCRGDVSLVPAAPEGRDRQRTRRVRPPHPEIVRIVFERGYKENVDHQCMRGKAQQMSCFFPPCFRIGLLASSLCFSQEFPPEQQPRRCGCRGGQRNVSVHCSQRCAAARRDLRSQATPGGTLPPSFSLLDRHLPACLRVSLNDGRRTVRCDILVTFSVCVCTCAHVHVSTGMLKSWFLGLVT